jgi:hypothetical protein
MPESRLADLMGEIDLIIAMTVASIKTLRARRKNQSPKPEIQNLKSQDA